MYELIYHSLAAPGLTAKDILEILETARNFNMGKNVTGCLLYHDNSFAQILEGKKEDVLELYAHIKKDKRHTHVALVMEESIQKRVFTAWSMAFENLEDLKLDNLNNYLSLDKFTTLIEVMEKPTDAKELFWYISKNIVKELVV